VLDLVSNGRVDVVLGAGYVRSEFAMFGVSLGDRARALDDGIPILQRALARRALRIGRARDLRLARR
jgi:alkanesulfonate monooxygenase SsuD/methylene tetrahydromethanopterin reductase-like flavin-dependent oxidoreductase (luciferase family)